MADLKGIEKARMELEDLYSGIPDDSVNLTFQDLAIIKVQKKSTTSSTIETIQESNNKSPLKKLPSLDFNRARQESSNYHHHNHHVDDHHHHHAFDHPYRGHHVGGVQNIHGHHQHQHHHHERSMAYDDDDDDRSMNSTYQEKVAGGGGRSRRPGIPHSNICTICSTYIYLFKHRCLVCGRVYCRSCVEMGMGEMTEGRKCIPCLGRKFSPRYIQRAGKIGCFSGYDGSVKHAELKWAEKGPRRSGEKAYGGQSRMMSRSRSPINQRPIFNSNINNNNSPSFVSTSSYSPYSPHHHYHLPL